MNDRQKLNAMMPLHRSRNQVRRSALVGRDAYESAYNLNVRRNERSFPVAKSKYITYHAS
jgi:hypothetical protein